MVPRPALVISPAPVGRDGLLTWALMITNAVREEWPGDVLITSSEALGLLIPSKVRTAKIAAVETAAAKLIARLDADTMAQVVDRVRSNFP